MRRHHSLAVVGVLLIGIMSSCTGSFGKKLTYGKSTLFYTSAVTEAEAKKLGDFLNGKGFFPDDHSQTIQLDKTGNSYQFRQYVKEDYKADEKSQARNKRIAQDLSQSVFNGAPVEYQSCDKNFKPIAVVSSN